MKNKIWIVWSSKVKKKTKLLYTVFDSGHWKKTEEIYTDPDLTLPLLAERISWSANNLSQIINDSTHQNFYDFINNYRIKKVINDLQAAGKIQLSILEISMEAGFNSKATFNKVFKRITGTTPSQTRIIKK